MFHKFEDGKCVYCGTKEKKDDVPVAILLFPDEYKYQKLILLNPDAITSGTTLNFISSPEKFPIKEPDK